MAVKKKEITIYQNSIFFTKHPVVEGTHAGQNELVSCADRVRIGSDGCLGSNFP